MEGIHPDLKNTRPGTSKDNSHINQSVFNSKISGTWGGKPAEHNACFLPLERSSGNFHEPPNTLNPDRVLLRSNLVPVPPGSNIGSVFSSSNYFLPYPGPKLDGVPSGPKIVLVPPSLQIDRVRGAPYLDRSTSDDSDDVSSNSDIHSSNVDTDPLQLETGFIGLGDYSSPLMATTYGTPSGDSRRGVPSPRPKGRDAKSTFCRNVTIYGHCRYENTCPYVHDPSKLNNPQIQNENIKKRFNADTPSFSPSFATLQPVTNGSLTPTPRSAAISPKAANAAIFTPKSQRSNTTTPSLHVKEPVTEWAPQEFPEFVPQSFDAQLVDPSVSTLNYDPFNASGLPALPSSGHQASLNPYAQDATALAGAAFYQNANTFQTSPAYHLYWPIGPQPTNLLAYQRTAHDFFIPESLREDLQKKSEITRQILPNSTLPTLEQYHSLVCLDTSQQKNQSLFGYQSWVYKAVSSKDGNTYALRRLEGFRLTNENAIRTVQPWKRVYNGSVVTIHDAFTTRAFGDSSLIIVTDYHPCSKSLAEEHFKAVPAARFHGARQAASSHIPEQVLWGYIVQIASALKAIHSIGLAARLITPSKILITSKNRIRINACAVLDVVQYDSARPLADLQVEDLTQLGRLILSIANNNPNAHHNMQKSLDHITRSYTSRLKDCLHWLLSPSPLPPSTPTSPTASASPSKDIDSFLSGITDQVAAVLDTTLHAEDTLFSTLGRELESSRLVRLLIKLNMINERPEWDPSSNPHTPASSAWSETGERYYLKLFRDYVFHQVDANGNPAVDLAFVIDRLNRLDAGSEERISLVSRDEQNVLVVSFREVKRGLESAFNELVKAGRAR